ncbi:MAG: MT-A70 family methyltransferase [Armatimonadota bacterium]
MIETPKHYGVIYADPPWRFLTRSAKGRDRCPEARHYETMKFKDIVNLQVVHEAAADDCVLLMWVVDWLTPRMTDQLLTAWGFDYKTVGFYWTKCKPSGAEHMIGGYWTRGNPEQCLLATRGHPKRVGKAVRKWIHAPVREHSRKPDEVYGRIEELMGIEVPKLELFSRTTAAGWDVWGNQVGKFHRELEDL